MSGSVSSGARFSTKKSVRFVHWNFGLDGRGGFCGWSGCGGSGSGGFCVVAFGCVNFFEEFADEGSCVRATADGFDGWFAFVECGEGVLGIVCGKESGEPRGDALAIRGAPLGGAGLACDIDAFDFCAACGALSIACHCDEGGAEFVAHSWVDWDFLADSVGVGGDDLIADRLDLEDKAGLVEEAAVGDDSHGLGHLEGAYENVTLTDGHIGDVAAFDCAFVDALHVVVVGDVSCGFCSEGNAGAAAESDAAGVVDDRLGSDFESGLVEPCVA